MALQLNTKAPDFSFEIDNKKIALSDFAGKWIVLYFYPKDNTSGCTKQACSFRDYNEQISKLNAKIIGVSPDNQKSHDNFTSKFNLNFLLAPDHDKTICNLYNVIGEKSLYGKKYMGVIRTTYIISPKGEIVHIFPKVTVEGHSEEVIEVLERLSK
ncbi:MAG: hypothetical protein HW421_3282 [Ignavibacteria bacterium]|nr:hypothetical protein [Ignavibacteria bacterium]